LQVFSKSEPHQLQAGTKVDKEYESKYLELKGFDKSSLFYGRGVQEANRPIFVTLNHAQDVLQGHCTVSSFWTFCTSLDNIFCSFGAGGITTTRRGTYFAHLL
jgi:hypothetical protein